MKYEIKGGNFPVLEITLNKGEKIRTEAGSMCWRDSTIEMETTTGGGLGKLIGRAFTNEKLFQNNFISNKDGSKISFGICMPGSIAAIEIKEGQSLICQKSSFLAGYGDIDLSVHFNKKIGTGLFGGEGFLMQKITGKGIVFLEIDGSKVEFDLEEGQQLVLSTGYLVSMSETCSIDIQSVKGIKNVLFGGQGLFNTVITGKGHVVTQTMPLAKMAGAIIPFVPQKSSND